VPLGRPNRSGGVGVSRGTVPIREARDTDESVTPAERAQVTLSPSDREVLARAAFRLARKAGDRAVMRAAAAECREARRQIAAARTVTLTAPREANAMLHAFRGPFSEWQL